MTKTESANRTVQAVVIEACEQLLECWMAEGCRLAIPNTNNLIMVGPQEWIAKNVPGVEAMVKGALMDSEITKLAIEHDDRDYGLQAHPFARAIEREVIARLAATTQVAPAEQPAIGKLLDEFSALPTLWGLNEPGALMRHSDVFKMLVNAGKTYLAATTQASTAQAEIPDLQMIQLRLTQILKPTPGQLSAQWMAADALYYLTRDERFAEIADSLMVDIPTTTSSTDAQAAAEVRDAALEEAAVACEAWGNEKVAKWQGDPGMSEDAKARAWDALQCATAIRALRAGDTGGASAKVHNGCEHCIGTYCLSGEKCRHCGHEAEGQGIKRAGDTGEQADGGDK